MSGTINYEQRLSEIAAALQAAQAMNQLREVNARIVSVER